MCCCLVHGACKSSRCLTRSCCVSFLLGALPWAVTFPLGVSLFKLQTPRWAGLELCVPLANLYHQRAQGTSRPGVRRSCGRAPALPAGLALCTLGCCFWRDWDTACASCFSLHPAGGPRAPVCYTSFFHLVWHLRRALKLITWVLQVSDLSVFAPNLVGEREWGREVNELSCSFKQENN